MNNQIMTALKYVNSIYPYVNQVFYGTDGRWLYCGEAFESPVFDDSIDVGILEDAADSVTNLPCCYSLEES